MSYLSAGLFLIGLLYLVALGVEGTDEKLAVRCPTGCKCTWINGKQTAKCTNFNYEGVPENLSPETQVLDLSGNRIKVLTNQMFKDAGLVNLQRLYLKNCSVEIIEPDAFQDLQVLVELDLSGNRIGSIKMESFRSLVQLRDLYLNANPPSIFDGLLVQFPPLPGLKKLEFRGCSLTNLPDQIFALVSNLEQLDLSGNLFENLPAVLFQDLGKLTSLTLKNNPWKCDCKLKGLRDLAINRKILHGAIDTKCVEPNRLIGSDWAALDSTDFACAPVILEFPPEVIDHMTFDDDITLQCLVRGDPLPKIGWTFNSKMISDAITSSRGAKHVVHTNEDNDLRWVNLTILNSGYSDTGEYICFAENRGGKVEDSVQLNIAGYQIGGPVVDDTDGFQTWHWILLAVSVVLILATILLLVWLFLRWRRAKITTRLQDSKDGPKLPLVEGNSGESASTTSPLLTKNSDNSSVEQKSGTDYPDLLNHPNGISPGDIPATHNPALDSRLILHHHLMRRLQSPYGGSLASFTSEPPLTYGQRPGYVTLPRRPRIPSWSPSSGAHSNYPPLALPTWSSVSAIGPKYDNLGPRTTANGGSKLSLNEVGLEPLPSTPMRSATLPTPNGRIKSGLQSAPQYFSFEDKSKFPMEQVPSVNYSGFGTTMGGNTVPPLPPPKPQRGYLSKDRSLDTSLAVVEESPFETFV